MITFSSSECETLYKHYIASKSDAQISLLAVQASVGFNQFKALLYQMVKPDREAIPDNRYPRRRAAVLLWKLMCADTSNIFYIGENNLLLGEYLEDCIKMSDVENRYLRIFKATSPSSSEPTFSSAECQKIYLNLIANMSDEQVRDIAVAARRGFFGFRRSVYTVLKYDCSLVAYERYACRRVVSLLWRLMGCDELDKLYISEESLLRRKGMSDTIKMLYHENRYLKAYRNSRSTVHASPDAVNWTKEKANKAISPGDLIAMPPPSTYIDQYLHGEYPTTYPTTATTKEPIMTNFYEVREFIQGVEVTKLTDDQVIQAIEACDTRIAGLQPLSADSTKVRGMIEDLQGERASMLAVLDAR